MNLIGKLQPVIIITAALLGLLLGAVTPLGKVSSSLIEVFLMLLLYILFLSIDLKQIKKSFTNVRFTLSAVVINFVFTPLFGYVLGKIFFPGSLDIRIGLLMLLVTPCTDWYLVFTGLSKGNVELGMSILPLNLILQIVLLPVYLLVLIGSEVTMDVGSLVSSVAMVLVIPFALAYITKLITKNNEKFKSFLSEQGDNLQLLFLCLAVVVMFASEGKNLLDNPLLLAQMFIPLLIFFAVLFFVAQIVGRLQKFPKKDTVALNMTTLARNSPLSLAIAVVTFPEQPLVSLALVIGPLIELPVLSVISGILKKWNTEP
jgi:ACR3 family arsenite efflux pump ArsB